MGSRLDQIRQRLDAADQEYKTPALQLFAGGPGWVKHIGATQDLRDLLAVAEAAKVYLSSHPCPDGRIVSGPCYEENNLLRALHKLEAQP